MQNASWVASLLRPDFIGMDESQLAKNVEKGKTDSIAANLHLLSRRCRYRIASSATVIEHDLGDLIRAEQYMCAEEPSSTASSASMCAPTFFDQHLYNNADPQDQAALGFLLEPPKNRLDFNDLPFLKQKIREGIAPLEFRSTYFDPPFEKSPEDAERTLRFSRVVVPYTPRELALVEETIASKMSVRDKMNLIQDIGDIPYAVPRYRDTGRARFEFACQYFDRWFFEEGVKYALYISPHRAAGVTRRDDAHPETIVDWLNARYDKRITVRALHGGNSEHVPKLQPDNTVKTETQKHIDGFLASAPAILVVTLPIINFGINQLAKGGVARAFIAGATHNRTRLDQGIGRLDRPGQLEKFIEVIQALSPGLDQARAHKGDVLKEKGTVYLHGRKSTAADEFWFKQASDNQRLIGQDYLSLQVATDRQKFARLSQLLQEQGEEFIEAGLDELYADLYNKNFLEFNNANFLRAVAAIIMNHLIPEILAKKKADGLSEEIDIIDCACGSWGLKRIMADYLRSNGTPIRIASRDRSKAMLSEKIGPAVLKDLYDPSQDAICSIDDLCHDASESKDITVTALGKDVLDHGENPPRRGRQRILSYVEDTRVARHFAVHTFPEAVFREPARLEKYLEAMPEFGWEVVDTLTGTYKSVKSADAPEQCCVHIVVMRKREGQAGKVQFDPFGAWQNIPPAVREGLDFTHKTHREATVRSGSRQRRPKGPPPDEKRSYATVFTVERKSKRVAKVEFDSPRVEEDREKFRKKGKLLEACSPPVRVVLMSYPSVKDIPIHSWLSQQLDDIVTSHKQVRVAYAHAIITRHGAALESELLRINAGQKQGMLKILGQDTKQGAALVFCTAEGNPVKGDLFPIHPEKDSNP